MCTYLHQRGATYYFRRVIPAELRPAFGGKAEFIWSLRTKDRATAKQKIPHHAIETDGLLADAATGSPASAPEMPAQRVSGAAARYEAAMLAGSLEAASLSEQDDLEYEARYEARTATPEELRRQVNEGRSVDIPMSVQAMRDLLRERDETVARVEEVRAAREAEKLADALPPPIRKASPAVPILATFDAYATEQNIKPGTARDWRAMLQKLIAFVGHDDAARLTLDELDGWRDSLLAETTKRGGKRDPRTVKSYLGCVKATLNWAIEKRKLSENVASKVVVRVPRKPRLRSPDFTADEATAILSATLSDVSGLAPGRARARRWIPWICAYTGARVNEISQLRGQDVRQVDGIWTIRITPEAGTVKANVARVVPLHPHLVEQGFPAVAEAAGDGPLFFDPDQQRVLAPGNRHFKKVGERLVTWIREDVGITDPGIQPNHAWRHTFKTKATTAGIPERVADAIQGHAPTNVSRGYGSVPLETMVTEIGKLPKFSITNSKDKG